MTPKDHAKIWNQAADVVARMDPRLAQCQQAIQQQMQGQSVSFSYSDKQAAAWDGYASAARVLRQIAISYAAEKELDV